MSSQADGFLAYNNLESMEYAMQAGFRGFLLDSCDCGDSGTQLCHELCITGTRDPRIVFDAIVSFLTSNPHDIIILEFQITDDSLWGMWESTTSDFQDLTYTHTSSLDPWPTINEMIDIGRRLVVFQHNGPDCDVEGECPMGVHG